MVGYLRPICVMHFNISFWYIKKFNHFYLHFFSISRFMNLPILIFNFFRCSISKCFCTTMCVNSFIIVSTQSIFIYFYSLYTLFITFESLLWFSQYFVFTKILLYFLSSYKHHTFHLSILFFHSQYYSRLNKFCSLQTSFLFLLYIIFIPLAFFSSLPLSCIEEY